MNKSNFNSCTKWLLVAVLVPSVILVAERTAYAQWTTTADGTNIYNTNAGNVGIGTGATPAGTNLEVVSTNPTTITPRNIANSQYSPDSGGAQWNGRKARGTPSAPTAILSGDSISNLASWGYDGTGFGFVGALIAVADENFSSTSHGTRLGFYTTADGTTAITERMRIDNAGNVGIGTTSPTSRLTVSGDITSTGNITATGNISAKYQDVAEWVPAKTRIAAGTVVVLDHEAFNSVEPSSVAYDTRVAGVVSAEPGIVLGEPSDQKVKVATTGRVRVHVDASYGAIHVGDLLVTSEKPGTAMRSTPIEVAGIQIHRPGTLIGKALESLDTGEGDILVLLSLQ